MTDTGWFRYGNTNQQTHRIASALLAAGVPVAPLAEKIYMSRSPVALKLLAWVLDNMTLYCEGRVALLKIPHDVFQRLGATSDDMEELVNQGLQIKSVCASVLLREHVNPIKVKASLRSKDAFDINQVARVFGGGGHKNASGCVLEMSLMDAEHAVVKEMDRVFN